jgi:hypothetical protein
MVLLASDESSEVVKLVMIDGKIRTNRKGEIDKSDLDSAIFMLLSDDNSLLRIKLKSIIRDAVIDTTERLSTQPSMNNQLWEEIEKIKAIFKQEFHIDLDELYKSTYYKKRNEEKSTAK